MTKTLLSSSPASRQSSSSSPSSSDRGVPDNSRAHHAQTPPPPPPPPPMSGNVPSPTSGVHTFRDGINVTIPAATSDQHHRLRHRHHHHHPQQFQSQQQQQQQQQQFVDNGAIIYGSHSLDDADVAAGSIAPSRRQQFCSPERGGGGSSPAKAPRSLSHHVRARSGPSSQLRTSGGSRTSPGRSRSVGSHTPSQTPEGVPPSLTSGDGSGDSYQQHSAHFFNSNISPTSYRKFLTNIDAALPRSPHAQKMDRGLRAAFGNSEHDFLLLQSATSSANGDDDDSYSSATSSVSARRRNLSKQQNSPSGGFPPLPPLEITTNRNPSSGSLATYPPYGLPSIEGSPSVVVDNDEKVMRLKSVPSGGNGVNGIPKPPLSDETPTNKFVVLGWDLSAHTRRDQFLISAGGTFGFSLLYGYLQELISVELCHRKLGLFLALAQFTGYTSLSFFFRKLEDGTGRQNGAGGLGLSSGMSLSRRLRRWRNWGRLRARANLPSADEKKSKEVPLELYVGLSALRAVDLGMTNLAMQYVNYPAKTLMKSTRVVFTMIFGVICLKKRYGPGDYAIVGLMVAGLSMFMHADAHSSAVFQPLGIIMLIVSLLCDGAISNLSEALMNQYEVGQDEFIFRLYSVATFFIGVAAATKGDLRAGLAYLAHPGTLQEIEEDLPPTWTVPGKMCAMALFSITGFLGSSCSAAITKSFGALTMSITSTARKATTIFLSFALFPNECTLEHVGGIFLFITSLVAKSLRASKRGGGGRHHHHHHHGHHHHKKKAVDLGSTDASNDASGYRQVQLRHKALVGDHVV